MKEASDASNIWRPTSASDGLLRDDSTARPIHPGELLRRIEALEREIHLLKFPLD